MPGKSNQKPAKAARAKAANRSSLAAPAGGPRKRFAPVAVGSAEMSRPARITQVNKLGDTRVVHREYIGDIKSVSTTGFGVVVSYPVNPGQVQTFPWLSAIAQRFESYRFRRLKFCYETEAPTSLPGSAIMTLDYDAIDPAPVSKQQAMSYVDAVRSPPWSDCEHVSRAENLNKQKSYFVRPGALPTGGTLTQYDVGNLFFCCSGVTASSAMGELYVEYDVELMTPVYESTPSSGVLNNASGAGSATATPFGTAAVQYGNIGISAAGTVVTLTNLTVGQAYVLDYVTVDSAGAAAPTMGTFVGLTEVGSFSIASGTNGNAQYTVTATAATASFVLTDILNTPVSESLIVSQLPVGAVVTL
jgi:hypothetical protein